MDGLIYKLKCSLGWLQETFVAYMSGDIGQLKLVILRTSLPPRKCNLQICDILNPLSHDQYQFSFNNIDT